MAGSHALVDVSIVNTGDESNLAKCKTALVESSISVNILVADNAGNRMGGFAKAHNANVKRGAADYVLILNPDVFVSHYCIEAALNTLQRTRGGVVGAWFDTRSLWPAPSALQMVARSLFLDRLWDTSDDETRTHAVPQVMGAFMMVKRSIWEKFEGFDERFSPLYYEDLDLCLRVSPARGVWHCAEARAIHIGCATTDRMKFRRSLWAMRNRIRFTRKWYGLGWALLVAACCVLVELPVRCVYGVGGNIAILLRKASRSIRVQAQGQRAIRD